MTSTFWLKQSVSKEIEVIGWTGREVGSTLKKALGTTVIRFWSRGKAVHSDRALCFPERLIIPSLIQLFPCKRDRMRLRQ